MSDELQKHLDGATRALVEPDLVLWEIGTAVQEEELITLTGEGPRTYLHMPSLERLDNYGSPTTSGSYLIGVSGDNFTTLTGDTDLQTVLDEIDTYVAVIGESTYWTRAGTTVELLNSGDILDLSGALQVASTFTREADSIMHTDGRVALGTGYENSSTADASPDDVRGKGTVIITPTSGTDYVYSFTTDNNQLFEIINNGAVSAWVESKSGNGDIWIPPGTKSVAQYDSTLTKLFGTLSNGLELRFKADDDSERQIKLFDEVLDIAGTANEIETSVSGDSVIIGIVTNPTLSGTVTTAGGRKVHKVRITSADSPYTDLVTNDIINGFADADITINLLAGVDETRKTIKNSGTYNIYLVPDGAETVEASTIGPGESFTLNYDTTDGWLII